MPTPPSPPPAVDLEAIQSRLLLVSGYGLPWTPQAGNNDGAVRATMPWGDQLLADTGGNEALAEWIAHCRDDVPALLAYARQLESERAGLVARVTATQALLARWIDECCGGDAGEHVCESFGCGDLYEALTTLVPDDAAEGSPA